MSNLLATTSTGAIARTAPTPIKTDADFVGLDIAYDAFKLDQRDKHELQWRAGATLADYLDGLPSECEWLIYINGTEVSLEANGADVLYPQDHIFLVLVPQGGNSMKSILRVALMAVSVVVAFIPGMQWWAAAGIAIASGLVSTFLLAPKSPKAGNDDSKTYGIDGPKNSATENIPYPVGYGEFRTAGNFSDCFTVNVGDNQYLYLRTVLNDGEISQLEDIEINEQPLANFKDVQWRFSPGTLTDPVNDWFHGSIVQINKGITLNTAYTVHQTTDQVNKVRFDLAFTEGLADINTKTNAKGPQSVELQCQYRLLGDTVWKPLPIASTAGGLIGGSGNTGNPTITTGGGLQVTVAAPLYNAAQAPINVTATDTTTNAVYALGSISATADEQAGYNFDASGDGTLAGNTNVKPQVTRTFSSDSLPAGTYAINSGVGVVLNFLTGGAYGSSTPTTRDASGGTGKVTFTDSRTVVIRKSIESASLPLGIYEVQICRTSPEDTREDHLDTVVLTDVAEITTTPVNMAGTANLSLRIKLSDQLNALPQVTAKCKLSLCNRYDNYGNVIDRVWTANPAWCALDVMLSAERGVTINPTRIDWPAWVDYAQWCDDNSITFNGVFADQSNVGDAVAQILRIGQAALVPFGTKLSVAIDRARDPVHVFTTANILRDSFQITYLPVSDRANEYEFTYYDKTDRNKAKTIRYVDPNAVTFNDTPRTATIDLVGVDNITQATAELWKQIYQNRLLIRTLQFDSWLDSINMTRGEVALVQHDMMEWGNSGKLAAGSTNLVLQLDQAVTLNGSSNALVHFDALQRASTTVYAVAGNSILVNKPGGADFDATTLLSKRVIVDGQDLEVISITNGSTYHTIALTDTPTGINPGDTIGLWDTDVLVETPVSAVNQNADGTSSLTLTTPLPQAPDQYANWAFGPVATVKKPYVLTGISGNGLEKRTLTMVEYNDAVYGPPEVELPVPTSQVNDRNPAQVRSLTLSFDKTVPANTTSLPVTLKWNSGAIVNYGGADIFVSINGGALESAGSAMNTNTYMTHVPVGADVCFVVVAFNKRGDRAATASAPAVTATAIPGFATLDVPTNFAVTGGVGKATATWTNPADMTGVRNFELQYKLTSDTNWSSGGFHSASPVEIPSLPAGSYNARVRSASPTSSSDWVDFDFTVTSGTAAASVLLSADATAFNFIDGVAYNANEIITVTAELQNTSETLTWSVSPAITLGTTANALQRTVAIADFGTNTSVTITATGETSGATASITLTRRGETTPNDSIIPDSGWRADFLNGGVSPWSVDGGFVRINYT